MLSTFHLDPVVFDQKPFSYFDRGDQMPCRRAVFAVRRQLLPVLPAQIYFDVVHSMPNQLYRYAALAL